MVEILPIKFLTETDANIFGKLNVLLARLKNKNLPVAPAIVITPPSLKLKTTLEYFDLKSKEIFEQTLELVKKEIKKIPVPENLQVEIKNKKKFLIGEIEIKSVSELWLNLLFVWLKEIKDRLQENGFSENLTDDLTPQLVIFIDDLKAWGKVYFDPVLGDSVIKIDKGQIKPEDYKNLDQLTSLANEKLFLNYQYEWIFDHGIKLSGILPFSPTVNVLEEKSLIFANENLQSSAVLKCAVKVFVEGLDYISSEKIFDLNIPRESFEDLTLKIIEAAISFPDLPILVKLPDKSEGMGKVRGSYRLIHQKSLLDPLIESLIFVRNKHQHTNLQGHSNVHIVIPFVRSPSELMQIKRELAVKKLVRKNSLQIWLEVCVPENIINLENYLICGIDGVVLNLDEMIAYINGFDHLQAELFFYKNEVSGLLKFLEDGLKLLHKSKIPFLVSGSISLHPQVLEFLVEKGVWGVVVEKYEAQFIKETLQKVEKKIILSRS